MACPLPVKTGNGEPLTPEVVADAGLKAGWGNDGWVLAGGLNTGGLGRGVKRGGGLDGGFGFVFPLVPLPPFLSLVPFVCVPPDPVTRVWPEAGPGSASQAPTASATTRLPGTQNA